MQVLQLNLLPLRLTMNCIINQFLILLTIKKPVILDIHKLSVYNVECLEVI